jgi:uncharacterized membrane protein
LQQVQKYKPQRDSIDSLRRCSRCGGSRIVGRFVVGERSVLQQLTLLEYAVDKKNQATQKSCASDFDYIDGLEQQEASIDKRMGEVKSVTTGASTIKKIVRMATTSATRTKVPLPSISLGVGSVR